MDPSWVWRPWFLTRCQQKDSLITKHDQLPNGSNRRQGATSLVNVVATLCISTDTPMSQQFWESVTLRTTRPQSTTRPREAPRKTAISIITKQVLYTLHWFADFLTCHVTTIRFYANIQIIANVIPSWQLIARLCWHRRTWKRCRIICQILNVRMNVR